MIKVYLSVLVILVIVTGIFLSKSYFLSSVNKQNSPSNINTASSADKQTQQASPTQATKTVILLIKRSAFEPNTLTVQKGTKLVFRNEDTELHWPAAGKHPNHTDYPEFDPGKGIKPAEEWSFVTDRIGNWEIHDHLNPNITGELTVTESTPNSQSE